MYYITHSLLTEDGNLVNTIFVVNSLIGIIFLGFIKFEVFSYFRSNTFIRDFKHFKMIR